jgi:hypothetical protein
MSENKVNKKYIGTDQVGAVQIELENDASIRSKSADGLSSQPLLKLDDADLLQMLKQPYLPGDATADLQAVPKQQLDSAIEVVQEEIDDLEEVVAELEGIFFQTSNIYVDQVNGEDSPGRGSLLKPYATLGYAYAELTNVSSSYTTWCAEKVIFNLAPGTYSENVTLGFKRARIALAGTGIIYTGTVTVRSVRTDYPGSGSTFSRPSLPAPYTGGFPSPTFEIIGIGAGTEGAFTADSFIFTQLLRLEQESADSINWQAVIGTHFICLTKTQLQGGLHVTHQNPGLGSTFVAEIEGCSISGGNIGVVPYDIGETLSSSMQLNIKAHSSQLNSTMGPRLTIQKIDSCRIGNIDVTLGGVYSGNTNASIRTVDNNTTPGIVNSSFNGSLYNIGQAAGAGTITYKMDANSYASLQEKTINNGSGTVAYNLIDKALGVSVSTAPVNYTRSAPNAEASFVGIDLALGQLLKLDGTRTMTGALNMGGFKVTNAGTPTLSSDLVTKAYADSLVDFEIEKFVLSAADITNQYIDLGFKAVPASIIASTQRINLITTLSADSDADFVQDNTGLVTRLSFQGPSATAGESPLTEGQILYFNYLKLV